MAAAALMCEQAGADGITVHLRGDRRHIQDDDLHTLRHVVSTYLNVEIAATDEMVRTVLDVRPDAVSLVPESPEEITTRGGLDVFANFDTVRSAVDRLREGGLFVALFIDPDPRQVEAAHNAGAQQVELCTAVYAEATLGAKAIHSEGRIRAVAELEKLSEAAVLAAQYGMHVAAGHGLTYRNVGAVAAIPEITEFNIGHNIIARAVFTGLTDAVSLMRARIKEGQR